MTQIRAFYSPEGCDFVYYLRYVLGLKGKYSSTVWLGRLVHTLLQQAYHGIPLAVAHRRVWQHVCGPVTRELQQWYTLDEAYHQSGQPATKARKLWLDEHPAYDELERLIEAYRDEFLTEDYTWAKSSSLAAYYRWSCNLVTLPRARLLIPHTVMVEGQPLFDEDGVRIERFADEGDTREHYTLLSCTLAGLKLVGAPDYVAIEPNGTIWIADGKVMSSSSMTASDIAEDAQLNLYVEMLRQSGRVEQDQPVYIGHVYYTKSDGNTLRGMPACPGTYQVWASPSPHAIPRLTKQLVRMDKRIRSGDFLPVRGIATGSMSPCPTCMMAAACQEHWKLYMEDYTL